MIATSLSEFRSAERDHQRLTLQVGLLSPVPPHTRAILNLHLSQVGAYLEDALHGDLPTAVGCVQLAQTHIQALDLALSIIADLRGEGLR